MTEWEPRSGDVYRLMRKPNSINNSNALVVIRKITDDVETRQTVELHPNNLTDKFEVIGHVLQLMASWLTKFLKRPTNRGKVIVKGK